VKKRDVVGQIGAIKERRVGWSLRCNMYCLDHLPEGLRRSEVRDLVELWSGRPYSEWGDDACADCGRTLGDVSRGDAATGALIGLRENGFEVSVSITLCDIKRDRIRLARLLRRTAAYLVRRALRRNAQVTDVSQSPEPERGGGYATRTVSVAFLGEKISDELRCELAERLEKRWKVRGGVEFDPPLAGPPS
jgi:hypothetical protein